MLWPWPSVHQGQLAPTTLPQCRLVSNPCPADLALAAPVLLLLSSTWRRVIPELRGRKGAFGGAKASQRCTKSFCGLTLQQVHCCTVGAYLFSTTPCVRWPPTYPSQLAPTTLPWAALSLPLSCSGFLTRRGGGSMHGRPVTH